MAGVIGTGECGGDPPLLKLKSFGFDNADTIPASYKKRNREISN